MTRPPAPAFPDLELWLSGQLRTAWLDRDRKVWVSREMPDDAPRPWMILVRDDGGPDGLIRATRRVGFRCFAPDDQVATDFARETSAIVRGLRFTGPMRDVVTSGPVQVDDKTRLPCRYFTAATRVRGRIE